jgi:dipeptidyl aminopeptidase/acylaminoacyl peptidase
MRRVTGRLGRFKTYLFISGFICAATAQAADSSTSTKRPFRVQDSIEMTRILDPENIVVPGAGIDFAQRNAGVISPDGAHIATLVTNGEVSNNTNVYRLVIYDTANIFAAPSPREVVRMSDTSSRPGITQIKWLGDSRRIAFIGERPQETPQIWIADTKTRIVTQLTHRKTAIVMYDIAPDGSTCVYAAQAERSPEPVEYTERGFVFEWPIQSLPAVLAGHYAPSDPDAYSDVYIGRIGQAVKKVAQDRQYVTLVSVAPDGRHVVERTQLSEAPPEQWTHYDDANVKRIVTAARDPHRVRLTDVYQYFVIDTATGVRHPLLNAPAPGSAPVLWTRDGQEIVVAEVCLPLSIPGAPFAKTHNVITIKPDGSTHVVRAGSDLRVTNMRWEQKSGRLVLKSWPDQYSFYEKNAGEWRVEDSVPERTLQIVVKQDSNSAPELEAQEWIQGTLARRKTISHLNPQLQTISLGEVKAYEWTSKDGMAWKAMMYLPPGYQPGTRYPLVIQTHGYSEAEFAPDGRATTAMAAQALANRDIIVVQTSGPTGWASRSLLWARQWMAGIESLIDILDDRGQISRQQVGLIGWSYTGYLVEYFITHSKYSIGAALAADNIEYGYWHYLSVASRPSSLSEFQTLMYGGSFWENPDVWLKESPGFNLDHVRTPLRIETDGDSRFYHWELYGGLQILHKPVELVIIPNASHLLVRPWHRMTSQAGSVDWFAFWLRGEEDPDRAKVDQYRRWREMRTDAASAKVATPEFPVR